MTRLLRTIAVLTLLGLAVLVSLEVLRALQSSRGIAPTWAARAAPIPLVVNWVTFVLMVISWIGAVYLWSVAPSRGAIKAIILVGLVLFGFFIGAFYILLAGKPRIADSAAIPGRGSREENPGVGSVKE